MMTVLALPHAVAAESAAAAFARQAPTDDDQCHVLLALCHAAVVAGARADGTPPNRTVLDFRQEGQALLAVRDALDAAHVIEERHGGRRLPCFDDPECAFLGMPATDPSARREKPR